MTRHANAESLRGANGDAALVEEFVANWRGLDGDAWIAGGGRHAVRRAIGEAVKAMVGDGGPVSRRRVLAWATADMASLELPGLLAEQGCEYVPWPSGSGGGGGTADLLVATGARDSGADVAGAEAASPPSAGLLALAAASDLGITTCSWAVAETGTIALYATPATGRLPSLLPTAHLALVRPSQVVKTIADGLRLLADYMAQHGGPPSAVNLISGPSRSADIEGDLAVGVHGPRRAGVIIGDW
ncbi:MAG: LUD domain-containing protein [Candidatus Limnocylindrales bacterium]|jgi:L-lactate dehydrogenase complex protein LldG